MSHAPRLASARANNESAPGRRRRALPGLATYHIVALALLFASILILGCARQYHWYDCGCGCVNYHYCPPPPLPYTPYCTCPTPVSSAYLEAESD